jgi:sulfur-oxidizing protein SoxY
VVLDTGLESSDRRTFLLGASAVATLACLLNQPAAAQQVTAVQSARITWEEAMRALIGDAKVADGRIKIETPELAENGNVVPFNVIVESPMSATDYVKAVHVFATANPRPDIASFYFTPESAKAQVSSRMRLASSQHVVVVAEMSGGQHFMGRRLVKVTIGGCGG